MVDEQITELAFARIERHGGDYEDWYVGIQEEETERDDSGEKHGVCWKANSVEDAQETMSWLLGSGLSDGGEYGENPDWVFIYTT